MHFSKHRSPCIGHCCSCRLSTSAFNSFCTPPRALTKGARWTLRGTSRLRLCATFAISSTTSCSDVTVFLFLSMDSSSSPNRGSRMTTCSAVIAQHLQRKVAQVECLSTSQWSPWGLWTTSGRYTRAHQLDGFTHPSRPYRSRLLAFSGTTAVIAAPRALGSADSISTASLSLLASPQRSLTVV